MEYMSGVTIFLPTAQPILIVPEKISHIVKQHQRPQVYKHWIDDSGTFKPFIPFTVIDLDNDRAGWRLYVQQEVQKCHQGIMHAGVFRYETWQLASFHDDHPQIVGDPVEIPFDRPLGLEHLDWGHVTGKFDYQQIAHSFFSPVGARADHKARSEPNSLKALSVTT